MGILTSLRRRTPLGWLQLRHDWSRLLVAMAGITFADVLIFTQLGFMGGFFETSVLLHRKFNGDIVLISSEARNLINLGTFSKRRLFQAQDIDGITDATAVYTAMKDWKHPTTQKKTNMFMVGMDPAKKVLLLPDVIAQQDAIKLPDHVLFDRGTRGDYADVIAQVEAGNTVSTEIDRRTVQVTGLLEVGASFMADGFLITSDQNFLRLFPRRASNVVNLGLLQLEEGKDPIQVVDHLNQHLPDDVQAMTKEDFVAYEIDYLRSQSAISFVFTLGSLMGFIVGVVIVYQILSTDVNDHTEEYATFKAMGYQQRYLLGIILEQALILSAFGFAPGLGLSMGLYGLIRAAIAIPITMPLSRVILVFILNIIMCTMSGAIATRKLQAVDPADMF